MNAFVTDNSLRCNCFAACRRQAAVCREIGQGFVRFQGVALELERTGGDGVHLGVVAAASRLGTEANLDLAALRCGDLARVPAQRFAHNVRADGTVYRKGIAVECQRTDGDVLKAARGQRNGGRCGVVRSIERIDGKCVLCILGDETNFVLCQDTRGKGQISRVFICQRNGIAGAHALKSRVATKIIFGIIAADLTLRRALDGHDIR